MPALAPISLASVIIGFISFSFTLAIWLHAFWDAFLTLGQAPSQLQDELSTLRQALYEEREYLKRKRRSPLSQNEGLSSSKNKNPAREREKIYYEGGPTKVINDAVKDLIREFKAYERPFLVTEHRGREKELEWSFDATQQYYRCDFWHRVLWLRSKGGVRSIADKLMKMQTRRIAVEVTEMHFQVSGGMGLVRGVEERLRGIEERLLMSRVGWEEVRGEARSGY